MDGAQTILFWQLHVQLHEFFLSFSRISLPGFLSTKLLFQRIHGGSFDSKSFFGTFHEGGKARDIPLIGEGWNFGEVADGERFVQASQLSLADSGIGTFSDRPAADSDSPLTPPT